MDHNRLHQLTRTCVTRQTRRAVVGLGAGLLTMLGSDVAGGKKHKHKHKHKRKHKHQCGTCGPCAACHNGKCQPKAAGTPCGAGKQCFSNGECVACDVCASGCSHTSLQAAIDVASDGETIQICPGTYATNANISSIGLTVVGAGSGAGGTVLDGQGLATVLSIGVKQHTQQIRGLRVTGGVSDVGAGILAVRGDNTLEDVVVTDNHATASAGGIYHSIGTLTLINCQVSDNSAPLGGGIHNNSDELILTRGSTITQNTATDGAGGIHNEAGATVQIIDGSSVTGNEPFNCAGTPAC